MSRGDEKRRLSHISDTQDADKTPLRRCIVSGQSLPKDQLIRFVVFPANPQLATDAGQKEGVVMTLVPDLLGKLPGRGLYVSVDAEALKTAMTKGLFARASRQKVTVPPDLITMTTNLLAKRVISLLAMARKAGVAVCGYEKVKDWLSSGKAICLLQACDGSVRGRDKFRAPEKQNFSPSCLFSTELGLAFGRERAIHAALAAGGTTHRVMIETAKLARLRDVTPQAVDDERASRRI